MITKSQIQSLSRYVIDRLRREWIDQGHNLSGEMVKSLEAKVSRKADGFVFAFLGNEYGDPVNTGVPSERIPYTPGRSKGGKSQYIQGLIRYAERRMNLRGKEAVSAAFAIARKHKREGMPTRASYRYSKNGRRTGWIDQLMKDDAELERVITDAFGEAIEILMFNYDRYKQ